MCLYTWKENINTTADHKGSDYFKYETLFKQTLPPKFILKPTTVVLNRSSWSLTSVYWKPTCPRGLNYSLQA